MKILLLRHSIIPGNTDLRYIGGRTDQLLTKEGVALASSLVDEPILKGVERLYVSPMSRCRQTASLMFPQKEQIVVEGLREMDFGDFETFSHEELMESSADFRAWIESGCTSPIPNGESQAEFSARCRKAFEQLVDVLFADRAGYTAVVAHGGTIMGLMHGFALPERVYSDWWLENCCGYLLEGDEKLWKERKKLVLKETFQPVPPKKMPSQR